MSYFEITLISSWTKSFQLFLFLD